MCSIMIATWRQYQGTEASVHSETLGKLAPVHEVSQ